MRAMILDAPGSPLREGSVPTPTPGANDVLVKVGACAPKLPLIIGHQIVGEVVDVGPAVEGLQAGSRVGIPWLGWTCGICNYCTTGRENLCDKARFTGYDIDGGYAQLAIADARFCFPIDPYQ